MFGVVVFSGVVCDLLWGLYCLLCLRFVLHIVFVCCGCFLLRLVLHMLLFVYVVYC